LRVRPLYLLLLFASTAHAGRHTVQRGETLEHVATAYGCPVEAVLRANHLNNTLVRAGTVVEVPACRAARMAPVRTTATADTDDDRARRALAVIDGVQLVTRNAHDIATTPRSGPAESIGEPWHGHLRNGERLPRGDGYRVRSPEHAFAATHVIEHLQRVIGTVRALHPTVHTLAIGDLSAADGGKLGGHHSHQSGVDVDVGFYFKKQPAGYPDEFMRADGNLDLEATWALVTAFAATSDLDTGVQVIFLDYDVQARLHAYARQRGVPDAQLAAILQYPRGPDATAGLVRHWPSHTDHLHVRFKSN
jgi:penicillin-insensitive murein endopeptidase/LysM domain-containing protein